MFIAFEGPDKTGKSTSAANLAASGEAIYNVTKDKHALMQADHLAAPELPITYDRIDWLTHMIYRLALPDHEWNDPRVRTVFAMPDTHLVVKLHKRDRAAGIQDELYDKGKLASVTRGYAYWTQFLVEYNHAQDFSLFKTVTVLEVTNDLENGGGFSQRLVDFSSPVFEWGSVAERLVHDDESLLELLRHEEQKRI